MLFWALTSGPIDTDKMMITGESAYSKGSMEAAAIYYSAAIKKDRLNLKAYEGLAKAYYNMGYPNKALGSVGMALNFDAQNSELIYLRGMIYMRSGVAEKAELDFNFLLLKDPKNVKVLVSRCTLYMAMEKLVEAIKDCSKAIELDDKNKKAFFTRGLLNMRTKNNEAAVLDLEKFLFLGGEKEKIAPTVRSMIKNLKSK